MRVATRLLAIVKPERFLEAGNPTGLTGLFTHPAPRTTLLYLYETTLEQLKTFPEHSVYRQAAAAVTLHRKKIVESVKPPGYEKWAEKRKQMIEGNKDIFYPQTIGHHYGSIIDFDHEDTEGDEWDGEKVSDGTLEGTRTLEERKSWDEVQESAAVDQKNDEYINLAVGEHDGEKVHDEMLKDHSSLMKTANEVHKRRKEDKSVPEPEPEPPLEASQIMEIEDQIGGGLIEEVIQVAEGELKLAVAMAEAKVWEQLEEKAPQGQWEYFARDHHTHGTQEPPKQ